MKALNIKALEEIVKTMSNDELAVIYNHFIEFYEPDEKYCTPSNVRTIIPNAFTFHDVADYVANNLFNIYGIAHTDIRTKMFQKFLNWCRVNTTIPQDWIKNHVSDYDVIENDWNYMLSLIECDYKRGENY